MLARGDQAVGQRTQPDHAQGLAQRIERGVFGMALSRMLHMPSATASAPSGRLMRNMLCQLKCATSTPPSTGPAISAVALLDADADGLGPFARIREGLRQQRQCAGINSAPAMPCTARPASSMGRPPASRMAEPATNSSTPASQERLRP